MLTARRNAMGADPAASLRRALLAFAMVSAAVLVFVESDGLVLAASAALCLFLLLGRRQFSVGTWVPVMLSLAALVLALRRGVPPEVLMRAADRMLFLAALIAMLGTLRAAAAIAPEVARAGVFLTGQPPSRRYLALCFGGHLFGVLINFGGLALLLDLSRRSMVATGADQLPEDAREARLRRMTLAIIRGFGLISLWSPFGFATNAILIALPGISYVQFGPLGFAVSFVFVAIGWAFDRRDGRPFRGRGLAPPKPPDGSWTGAALLLGHVLALGAAVFLLHGLTALSFQQALILAVPGYAALWAAASGLRSPGGAAEGLRQAGAGVWGRLSDMAPEVGVFAAAGFLPVLLLALIPMDSLREGIGALGLGPVTMALGLTLSIFALAFLGVNPIVSASVLGSVAVQLAVPNLSDTAIALGITGGWTAVIGLSPFITTIIITATIVERPVWRVGPVWNGAYSLTILTVWLLLLGGLMISGVV
ncbi:hypothetical protein [Paracoccus xiamenensis]|uniref:hypothetical protein n=1 Tax=Paracoccus xiamenensis TaxID=2714901 RepID=UPI0014093E90|nr:hypothetical protein [Paracoccus xiamenensis]NHF74627.1 hypothetical protein [Paracoccus xiamenensis]